jgi:hypothetical protein
MIKKIIAIACFTAASAFAQQTINGPCTGSFNITGTGPLTVTALNGYQIPYVEETSPSIYVYLDGSEATGQYYWTSVPAGIYVISMGGNPPISWDSCFFDW